jgi:hypothetical protein
VTHPKFRVAVILAKRGEPLPTDLIAFLIETLGIDIRAFERRYCR